MLDIFELSPILYPILVNFPGLSDEKEATLNRKYFTNRGLDAVSFVKGRKL
jgi:hypothetical protein